jgi:hypothetical protein
LTTVTTVTTICDGCGEEIDTTQKYFKVDNPSDPAVPILDFHPHCTPHPEEPPVTVVPPTVTTLNPDSVTAGSEDTHLHVAGTGFVDGASILLDGMTYPTNFYDDTHVSCIVGSVTLAEPGTIGVAVRNPDGGESSSVNFQVA